MVASPSGGPGLKRSLSVWAAVGLSVALMAPSMAANINPQGSALHAGRAVPLTFLIAAVGVLLVAYSFVRLCQYFHHSGSVYAFVGATLGPRTGVVAGWGLLGTYTFYAVVTSAAAGIFGTAFLQEVGIWHNPPTWAPFMLLAVALLLALWLAIMPLRRGPGGRQGVHQLAVAAGRPRLVLRRQLGRQRDHAGHGDQRVRLLPGVRGRGGPAGLRAVQGHGGAPRIGPEQLTLGYAGLG